VSSLRPPAATRLDRIALGVAALLTAALAFPLRHYVTDDTFIHLQYARHLAHGQGFVFNPGERVYGSTSPLWVLLLGGAIALGADGLGASKALGAAALGFALFAWWRLARQTIADPRLRALAIVTWAAHAWMLRWSLSGMETPLAVALVLAGLVAFTAGDDPGARRFAGLPASVWWALAALARPECGLLLVLWSLLLIPGRGLSAGFVTALRRVGPGAIVLGAWLVFARAYFGTFWPNTLAAKAAGGAGIAYTLEQLERQAAIVGATDGVLVLALVAATLAGLRGGRRPRLTAAALPWAWLVAVPLLYALRGVPVLSRYLVPLLPVLGWLAWRALDGAPAAAPRRVVWAGALVAALALAQNLYAWARVVRPQVDSFSAGMQRSLVPWGRWFAEHTPAGTVIAAPDIGALGYYSQRRVVDLAGLVTPAMVPELERMSEEDAIANFEFARFSRPAYVVDRAPQAWDLEHRSPYAGALARVGQASLPNLGIARPGAAVYSIYRIDWGTVDSIAHAR